jgi:hypothetical protein
MGYRVKIYPRAGRSGWLEWGKLAPAYSQGTYYPHPSAANAAAGRWVKKHPGGRAEVVIYSSGEVVNEFQ